MKRGVDLDGTLAFYEEYEGPAVIGEPIASMVERVQKWLEDGDDVVIFTARVYPGKPGGPEEAEIARAAIVEWCETHIGQELEVTCMKDPEIEEFWDDRAIRVKGNTGEIETPELIEVSADILTNMEW